MITIKDFILKLKEKEGVQTYQFTLGFRFPYIQLEVASLEFSDRDDEEKEEIFAKWLETPVGDLRRIMNRGLILPTYLVRASERKEPIRSPGYHWLAGEMDITNQKKEIYRDSEEGPRVLHFYGFKGGQARSTILAMLARTLADDGWRVLAIDADLEAPSMDILFRRRKTEITGTLLGLSLNEGWGVERVYNSAISGQPGFVDLLPCRPSGSLWDPEFAAFLIQSATDPDTIRKMGEQIMENARSEGYHAIFFDHRSGLSSTPLFWMRDFQGPVCAVTRLDGQWTAGADYFHTLFQNHSDLSGIFVSWRPDAEEPDEYRSRNAAQIEELLDILAKAEGRTGDEEGITLTTRWIEWPYDPEFRYSNLPDASRLTGGVKSAIYQIRSELSLTGKKESESIIPKTSMSGAKDEGILIHTRYLRDLLAPRSGIRYIFGRKGTGKTRLYKEMVRRELGIPLLTASDFYSGSNESTFGEEKGINSGIATTDDAAIRFINEPGDFWWSLLLSALESEHFLRTEMEQLWNKKMKEPQSESYAMQCKSLLIQRKEPLVFLIDGVETAFTAKQIATYTNALFRFLNAIENDISINRYITVRLFIRTDLQSYAAQNVEQQTEGKAIYLAWDTQSILNFLVARIHTNSWFRENFNRLIEANEAAIDNIRNGKLLDSQACEEILKTILPDRIPRFKVMLMSFLKNYFSDASGMRDSDDSLNYYPRIFDSFVRFITDPHSDRSHRFSGERIKNNKVSADLMAVAHDVASREYLGQVEEELNHMIVFDKSHNKEKIRAFLEALSGEQTPFSPNDMAKKLREKLKSQNLTSDLILDALNSMKTIGIFEEWPKDTSLWKVGRIFKHSLNMKFRR